MAQDLSRRRFAGALGASLGATLVPAGVPAARASVPLGTPESVTQLNSNENPYGPSPRARDALAAAAARAAARYPDAAEEGLQKTIARLHGVTTEQVILGCGSGEILQVADMAFLGPGKNVVVSEPTFEAVIGYAKVTTAEAVKVPQTADFRHDLPRMAAACNASTGLVYVCNPNNPTGTIVSRDELELFLARTPRTAVVLVDEAYHHFVEDPAYASATGWIGRDPRVVVARTFSKVFGMAGLRLGYAVGSRENIAAMRAHLVWSNANAAALAAAAACLEDEEHVTRQRQVNSEVRGWLCRELERDGRRFIPSHANFVMIALGRDVGPVIEAFAERKILVGRRFPSMETWLRVSIGTRAEMRAFADALREIVPAGRATA